MIEDSQTAEHIQLKTSHASHAAPALPVATPLPEPAPSNGGATAAADGTEAKTDLGDESNSYIKIQVDKPHQIYLILNNTLIGRDLKPRNQAIQT